MLRDPLRVGQEVKRPGVKERGGDLTWKEKAVKPKTLVGSKRSLMVKLPGRKKGAHQNVKGVGMRRRVARITMKHLWRIVINAWPLRSYSNRRRR